MLVWNSRLQRMDPISSVRSYEINDYGTLDKMKIQSYWKDQDERNRKRDADDGDMYSHLFPKSPLDK